MTTATQQTASERYRERIIKRAEQCFEHHVCEQTLNAGDWKAWTCQEPGRWAYWFNITLKPGWLILDGDIGFVAFSRERDMLPWIRGAINDPDYMAGKVPSEIKVHEFNDEIAREAISDAQTHVLEHQLMADKSHEDVLEFFEELQALTHDGESGYYAAVSRMQDEGIGDDPVSCRDLTAGFLYQCAALKWWLNAIRKDAAHASR